MSDARPRILIVDDDPIVAESLADFVAAEGHEVATAHSAAEALETIAQAKQGEGTGEGVKVKPRLGLAESKPLRPFTVVITDVAMPGMDGMELIRRLSKDHPEIVALMLTGYGTIEQAVEAVRLGAVDYLTKPVVDDELRMALERALRQQALLSENQTLRAQLDERFGLDSIVGSDARMLRTYDLIQAVAPTKTTVLMSGESGTGKSLIAHAIHLRSPRRSKPFVELACGSIPETLLESELFGHVKGAFTGAHADKAGKFLAADGGTLFLDEINSASAGMQLKLLRVLQEKRFEPVGSNQTIEVDVRVVLATNQPLEDLVAQGKFRQDLYYRINVVKIDLPPLRERVSDIPLLAEHFLTSHAAELGKTLTGFEPEAMDLLRRYHYPGNVRELSNIIERASVLSRRPTICVEDLPPNVLAATGAPGGAAGLAGGRDGHESTGSMVFPGARGPGETPPRADEALPINLAGGLEEALREPERRIILAALRSAQWNRVKAAELLQINRTTLYKKMAALGIDPAVEARAS
ncbi:MAG: sigma-54-dependent transcriptional regulator [Phycisphaerales bacterium]